MTALLAALRRLPLWLWPLLALALYAGYLHRQVVHAQRDAAGAKEAAAVAAEKAVGDRLKSFEAQSQAVQAKLDALSRQSAAAAARTRQVEADLAGARAAGAALEAAGSLDDVIRYGRGLGYHPVPARRPQ